MESTNVWNAGTQYLDNSQVSKITNAFNVYILVNYALRHRLYHNN